MKDQIEEALADLAYIEASINDLVTDYRQAALRYLDQHPEPGCCLHHDLERVQAAEDAGRRAIGLEPFSQETAA